MPIENTPARRLYLVLAILVILVPLLAIDFGGVTYKEFFVDDVSDHDIRADRSFVLIDNLRGVGFGKEAREVCMCVAVPVLEVSIAKLKRSM